MKFITVLLMTLLAFNVTTFAAPQEKIVLTSSNTVVIDGGITPRQAREFGMQASFIRTFLPEKETMYILLNSNGGNTEAGYIIAKMISLFPNTKVVCAWCASAAGMIFVGSQQEALATQNSRMMMHEMKWMISLASIKKFDFAEGESDNDTFNKILYSRMGISKEVYVNKILNKMWVVEGPDLLKLKLANKLVTIKCDEELQYMYSGTCDLL